MLYRSEYCDEDPWGEDLDCVEVGDVEDWNEVMTWRVHINSAFERGC